MVYTVHSMSHSLSIAPASYLKAYVALASTTLFLLLVFVGVFGGVLWLTFGPPTPFGFEVAGAPFCPGH